jgi:hypothetical protein
MDSVLLGVSAREINGALEVRLSHVAQAIGGGMRDIHSLPDERSRESRTPRDAFDLPEPKCL